MGLVGSAGRRLRGEGSGFAGVPAGGERSSSILLSPVPEVLTQWCKRGQADETRR